MWSMAAVGAGFHGVAGRRAAGGEMLFAPMPDSGHVSPSDGGGGMMGTLDPVQIRGIAIDPQKWEVRVDGAHLSLTRDQFLLLHILAKNAGKVLRRQQIVDYVHGPEPEREVTERSVNVQICGLRRKLGELGKLIQTERGVGYRFRV
jgi:DNA-binding response OmpR family regulator